MRVLLLVLSVASGVLLTTSRSVPDGKRLIQTSETEPATWMTEEEIFGLIQQRKGFMDVTDFHYPDTKITDNAHIDAIPEDLRYNEVVQTLITALDSSRVRAFLEKFSSFNNRYYTSATGRESQQWLLSEIQSVLNSYSCAKEVEEVDHGWAQKSIVVRLIGSNPTVKDELVILGAHLDSVTSGANARAPGADDDGSGTVAILEALRAIVNGEVSLQRTLEFHWYAAEEAGLRGSQAIAQQYKAANKNVLGMLNLDIVGYHVSGNDQIAIYTDYANAELTQFIRVLTDGYLTFGRINRTCGYGCSDHASWNRQGFPSVFVAEKIDTPYMHRVTDTIDTIDFNQMDEFIKLCIGYAIELGEPLSS